MSNFGKILALAGVFALGLASRAAAAPVPEPSVFESRGGVLDLLMVARPTAVTGLTIPGFQPTGWAYQVCYRPAAGNACPAGTPTPYGGVRLALQPGDWLKIRLVNKLPPVDPATIDHSPDDPLLPLNPTNLHTHGLIVDALPNTAIPPAIPVYGDFIFTSIFNPANGDPAVVDINAYNQLHAHGDVVKGGMADYAIHIPANHPRGLYYFHPHMHGLSLSQVSAGMTGIITIGDVGDYMCLDELCETKVPAAFARHLILKEMQVLPGPGGGTPHLETDAAFCQPDPQPGETARKGFCPSDPSAYPAGGYWFYTVNGAQFPTIAQASPDGELWRIQNASGSGTYDLVLTNDATGRKMPVQIVAMDGVSINVPQGASEGDIVKLGGAKFRYAPCPAGAKEAAHKSALVKPAAFWAPGASSDANDPQPVCATEIYMMPSSRVEIWVSYTDESNRIASAPANETATLRTLHYNTGPVGDDWPAVELAKVKFASGARKSGLTHLYIRGDALRVLLPDGVFRHAHERFLGAANAPSSCPALAKGHIRRVYFANMGAEADGVPLFGIGYEELDERRNPVPGTFHAVEAFNPAHEICVPLGPANTPRFETWELVNLSAELHNFHIHQTKFRVLSATAPSGSVLSATSADGAGVMADNIPLPFATTARGYKIPASGACSIEAYRDGRCIASPVVVQIPFSRIGRFVFHCHILEHEDGGMMHAIRVVRSQ